jgi:hypothetical protein
MRKIYLLEFCQNICTVFLEESQWLVELVNNLLRLGVGGLINEK